MSQKNAGNQNSVFGRFSHNYALGQIKPEKSCRWECAKIMLLVTNMLVDKLSQKKIINMTVQTFCVVVVIGKPFRKGLHIELFATDLKDGSSMQTISN